MVLEGKISGNGKDAADRRELQVAFDCEVLEARADQAVHADGAVDQGRPFGRCRSE